VAFFSSVDLDHVMRKEVDMDCITPSQPEKIPHGQRSDIYDTVARTGGKLEPKTIEELSFGWQPYGDVDDEETVKKSLRSCMAKSKKEVRPENDAPLGLIRIVALGPKKNPQENADGWGQAPVRSYRDEKESAFMRMAMCSGIELVSDEKLAQTNKKQMRNL
jgi:hypothetical protein